MPAAVVKSHPKAPPQLSEGTYDAEGLKKFEQYANNYFVTKKVAADDQTRHLLGSFEGYLITNWINSDVARISELPVKDFFTELRALVLPRDWHIHLRARIHRMEQ
ncbi:hypothetical protein BKA70DRAFT_1113906 [Coprinopsis sp. MPI-PUGE-AT-0042]|nr:hypothetical protein BKA70DRAFT_1113906 [Coprinopsis sp. MPI-PUGE-AT-0042]